MEESKGPLKASKFIPLLSFIPVTWLAYLSSRAFDNYNEGISLIKYYHQNIYEPYWMGGVVWAAAAVSLATVFMLEALLRMSGKRYEIPSVALALAGTWNFFLGLIGFLGNPLSCGLSWVVSPEERLSAAIYLTAITVGLLIAGIGAIKYDSLKNRSGRAAKMLCLVNGVLAGLGTLYVGLMACLID